MAETSIKNAPVVKPWVRRVVAISGWVPESVEAEAKLGWYGVELARFLNFCKGLPADTDLRSAMEGYGRMLKGNEPPRPDWRLEQVREALRLFQRGISGWKIAAPDAQGEVRVDFRVKTQGEMQDFKIQDTRFEGDSQGSRRREFLPAANTDKMPVSQMPVLQTEEQVDRLLERAVGVMRVRRLARRTEETYLNWMKRFLSRVEEQEMLAATTAAVQGFLTWLAVERKVSASTQNQALSAVIF